MKERGMITNKNKIQNDLLGYLYILSKRNLKIMAGIS